jgi:pantoate--beta-alanine ligase
VQTLDRDGLAAAVEVDRRAGRTIGLVPTMGFLHEGHASLIRWARTETDRVVLTIFVNPLQFGPSEDFERYPRDLDHDLRVATDAGVDYVFSPEVADLYPKGAPATRIDVGRIGEIVEGASRPGHFSGVATVCVKLFNLTRPHRAYFGRKDAQQLAVIRQVVADLDVPVEIVACPTVREPDGLAMSSRNAYLDPGARKAAPVLFRALCLAQEAAAAGERSAARLRSLIASAVASEPSVHLEYAEVVNSASFEPMDTVEGQATVALAAVVGSTRLIDNVDTQVEPSVGTGKPA